MNSRIALLLSPLMFLLPTVAWAAGSVDCTSVDDRGNVAVVFAAPADPKASAVTLIVEYPRSVAIPGTASDPTVRQRIESSLSNTTIAVNDSDQGLRVVLARAAGVAAGEVCRIELDHCQGAPPLGAAQFHCRVEAAGSATGFVAPTTCTVKVLSQ